MPNYISFDLICIEKTPEMLPLTYAVKNDPDIVVNSSTLLTIFPCHSVSRLFTHKRRSNALKIIISKIPVTGRKNIFDSFTLVKFASNRFTLNNSYSSSSMKIIDNSSKTIIYQIFNSLRYLYPDVNTFPEFWMQLKKIKLSDKESKKLMVLLKLKQDYGNSQFIS